MLTTIAATALVSSAVGALEGRAECVLFTWHGENGRRGAMSIPVTVDGRSLQWQVDTGADVNMSYGDIADQLNLSKKNDR